MYTNVDLTRIDSSPQFPLGAVYCSNDRVYRYVYYHSGDGSVSGSAGKLAYMAVSGTTTVPSWTVTCDHDSATAIATNRNMAVGILCAALTNGTYGWIQSGGANDNTVTTDGNVDFGESLIPAAADGTFSAIAAGSNHTARVLGFALAGDGTGTSISAGGIYLTIDSPSA